MIEQLSIAANGLSFPALAAGSGPLVLLLHGFPDSPETFLDQLPVLAAHGYRAVAPTLRGYAPEAQPADGDYHAVRMAEDVVAIASALGADEFDLIGHDWGASIAFAVAGLAPDRVRSLAALAVPHPVRFAERYAIDPEQQVRSTYILEFQAPSADAMIVADDFAYLERLWRSWSPGWQIPPAALSTMRATFGRPGVSGAALAYYRQAFDATSAAALDTQRVYALPLSVPTLGIAGDTDGCIAPDVFASAMQAADFPAGLTMKTIPAAGHFLHREAPAAVNAALLDWLAQPRG